MPSVGQKLERLTDALRDCGRVIVAFSGGVDSTFLLAACRKALPKGDVLAVTGNSDSLPAGELEHCVNIARELDAELLLLETREFSDPRYVANPQNRCFFCKSELYGQLTRIAKSRQFPVIANGENHDDLRDFRPGRQAATEAGVRSPLSETALNKSEIREISRQWGLPTWNRAESPCLSSRVSFGVAVEASLLRKIDRAEKAIRDLGFTVVRARTDGDHARIEIGTDELPLALEARMSDAIRRKVMESGFERCSIDPSGYRRGGRQQHWK